MIKKTVNYTDIIKNGNNYDEIEKEEIVRFVFTLPAIKLYEQKTGNRFFEDYSKAWGTFMTAIKNINIHKIEELTLEEQLKIVPILYDPIINEFMMGIVPCLYAEIHDGKYVQNDETVDIAENSLWLMELININFFTEIFKEISANQSKMPNNQTNNKSKKN